MSGHINASGSVKCVIGVRMDPSRGIRKPSLRIFLADDHEVMREGTRMLIERQPGWEVCGVAGAGREAVQKVTELQPDIVVLDLGMPDFGGLEAARQIKQTVPNTEVLIFTAHDSDELIQESFDAGAKSYVMKSQGAEHLIEAIEVCRQPQALLHRGGFQGLVCQVPSLARDPSDEPGSQPTPDGA